MPMKIRMAAPSEVVNALTDLPLHVYPDPEQRALRKTLSAYTDQPVERLIAGAGGDEIIDLLLRLFVEPGDKVIDCEPTFGMYGFCARIADAEVVSLPRNDDWSIDLGAIRSASRRHHENRLHRVSEQSNRQFDDGG